MERLSQGFRYLGLLFFACALFAGCSRKTEEAKIQVYIPKLTSQEPLSYRPNYSGKSVSAQSTSFNSLLNPTTLAEFNCFIVFVGGAGFEGGGSCTVSDGTSFKLGAFGGGVTAGTLLTMTVPSGSREIVLVGFKTEDTAICSDFHSGMETSSLSEPFVLARESKNVVGALMDVNLSPSTMTAKVTDCKFAEDSGGGGAYFGNGGDGNVVGSGITQVATNSNPSGQFYSSRSVVDAITNMNDGTAQIIVQSGWNSSTQTDVRVGNEMMLYVLGGNEGMPGGCGNLFPGFSISGMVTNVETGANGNRFKMSFGDSRWLSIPAANLTASAQGSGGHTFCRVMAIRVPHFDNITVSSGSRSIKISTVATIDLGQLNHILAGLLPMRVKGAITVDPGASLNIITDFGGYGGGNSVEPRGQSYIGKVTTAAANPLEANASGGGFSTAGCGGGHGGRGGCAGSDRGGYTSGDQYGCNSLDNTMSCLKGKFFVGGGGGANASGGGSGGGAIRFYAKSIYNNGTILLSSIGMNGSSSNDGGGAGGSVFVVADLLSGTGNFGVDVFGGPALSSGGVGGGGRAHLVVKSAGTFTGGGSVDYSRGNLGNTSYATHGTCKVEGLPASFCPAL